MRKVMALLLAFILIIGVLPVAAATKREVWVSSPGITCGLTEDEIMFNKAVHLGKARLYKLDAVGERYYLGVLEEQVTNGGSIDVAPYLYGGYAEVYEKIEKLGTKFKISEINDAITYAKSGKNVKTLLVK